MQPFDYLSEAEGEIFRVLSPRVVPDRSQLRKALAISCTALKQLQDDAGFFADLDRLRMQKVEYEKHFREITGTVAHFVDHFLPTEKKYLINEGLPGEEVEALMWFAARLRGETQREGMEPRKIKKLVGAFARECCSAAEQLEHKEIDEHNRGRHRQLARRAFLLIGGAVIVYADAAATVTAFLSPAGAAVSGSLGGAMIKAAVTLSEEKLSSSSTV